MGLLALLGLTGCGTETVIYSGAFDSEPYELVSVETKGFSTNSINYAVKLGRWKTAKIDALTTDWGPPYADDLYGNTRRVYINKNHIPYSNERDNAVTHKSTMLYLSPSRFSEQAFAEYSAFMQSEWPKIDRQFGHDEYNHFPHIIGLVYGEQGDFARVFRGEKEGKNYLIKIEPDGRIRYMGDNQGANDEYSGLSEKVQMPGKLIYVATGKEAGLPLSAFQAYKDKGGKTLSDYFTLTEKR